ncbi:MAG: OsmC family protein [Pseudomonadota bacterium]
MTTMTVQLRNIADTEAAMGWAGVHTMVVDRPDGIAGGKGLGFNGGQLLALAIGGCLCNDLRYVAHGMGIALTQIEVDVTLTLEGDPLLATAAAVTVRVDSVDGADVSAVIERAGAVSTVSNSVARGFPVTLSPGVS